MELYKVIKELESTSSRNEKIEILKRNRTLEFQKLLELTYDSITYKYWVTNHNLSYAKCGSQELDILALEDILEPLFTRKVTGNAALVYMQSIIEGLTPESQYILKCILDRDLHCGINLKTAEKVFGEIAFKIPYMRCSLMDKVKNVKFPAILQIKEDGTYRTFIKNGSEITAYSRSGEEYEHPSIEKILADDSYPNGAYIGELIVNGLDGSSSEVRYASNGALNSLNPPEDVTFYVWDLLTLDELRNKASSVPYRERFARIPDAPTGHPVQSVGFVYVDSLAEAKHYAEEWISFGYEGAVLKDLDAPFKDGTSKFQIKMKQEFEIDVKCTGFTEGKGKFASTFGAIEFESADGKLQGQCSGLSDAQRLEVSKDKNAYIGKILTIKGNGLTLAKNSDIYGVMHPQFCLWRNDKSEADSIERIKEIAKGF